MDWSQCADVEQVAGKVSGQVVVKGTRILADQLVENANDGYTAEDLSEIFEGLEVERARRVIDYARAHAAPLRPS